MRPTRRFRAYARYAFRCFSALTEALLCRAVSARPQLMADRAGLCGRVPRPSDLCAKRRRAVCECRSQRSTPAPVHSGDRKSRGSKTAPRVGTIRFGITLFLLATLCCVPPWVGAETPDGLKRLNLRQSPAILRAVQEEFASAGKEVSTESRANALRKAIGLSEGDSLRLIRSTTDDAGASHAHYERRIRDVPAWGERIVVSTVKSGKVKQIYGRLTVGVSEQLESTEPTVRGETVAETARSFVRMEFGVVPGIEFSQEPLQLVVYPHRGETYLAYVVELFADSERGGEPTNPTFIFDATTGKLIDRFDGLRSFASRKPAAGGGVAVLAPIVSHEVASVTTGDGTGPGGNEKVGRYTYGGTYDPFEVTVSGSTYIMDNANVRSVDLNHGTSGSTPFEYPGPENTHKAINGAYCPINDAHFFGGVVYRMYRSWYGTDPLSVQLTQRVHYSSSYENAFWTSATKTMTYGDGRARFYPLVSLDVCAHEVSHGFTDEHSDLIYRNQPGGINEAFSDMAGEVAESYMYGKNDFEVGASIFKRPGEALRYMYDPPKDGRSIDSANDYYDGLNVHYSSGVYNKAFYLLAKKWSNPRKAFHVFIYANQNLWGPNETFESAARKVVDAAGTLGYSQQDVRDAFAAVDVSI